MIEQDIIVVQPPPVQQYPVTTYNRESSAPGSKKFPDITCVYDLQVWLEQTGFSRGDYVTYNRQTITAMTQLSGCVYTIEQIVTDYDSLKFGSYLPYHPLLVLLKPLPYADGSPNLRTEEWRDIHWLRKCTEEEIHNIIRPHLDRVRHYSQTQ